VGIVESERRAVGISVMTGPVMAYPQRTISMSNPVQKDCSRHHGLLSPILQGCPAAEDFSPAALGVFMHLH
jgi:hypothetical protein